MELRKTTKTLNLIDLQKEIGNIRDYMLLSGQMADVLCHNSGDLGY